MTFQIVDFSAEYIPSAVQLFLHGYRREKEVNNLLPDKILNNTHLIFQALLSHEKNAGVIILSNETLIAYLVTGSTFTFKNQKAAMVPEYGHSAIDEDKNKLYRLMYAELASKWIQNKIHLHIIGHFSHDKKLAMILFQLGFGAIVTEKLRNLSPVNHTSLLCITYENDPRKLINLEREHRQYYQKAPIFIKRNSDLKAILVDLKNHVKHGDKFIVCYDHDLPIGYFTVGPLQKDGEGFLLQDTNTAQMKSAFIKPSFRGKGVGTALLNEAIDWARENGFERLFVEHETANYYGGQFWDKYFSSYLNFSMRYIDNTI
jgi:GNAT superfamily N-acetyltransferase